MSNIPNIPAPLADVIALHRAMFGGFEMMAENADDGDAAKRAGEQAEGDDDAGDNDADDDAQEPNADDDGQNPDDAGDNIDWKAEARKWETRAKDNRAAAKQQADQLTADLDEAKANSLRFEVALSNGLTLNQAKRLIGTTREELTADAAQLLADIAPQAKNDESPAKQQEPGRIPTPGSNAGRVTDKNAIGRAVFGV